MNKNHFTFSLIHKLWIRVDPSTRCWDIAQKLPKCKNSPLTPIVFISPFSARRGPLTPKRREDISGTRVHPHAKFLLNRPMGCREIIDKKANKQKTYSKINTSPFARLACNKEIWRYRRWRQWWHYGVNSNVRQAWLVISNSGLRSKLSRLVSVFGVSERLIQKVKWPYYCISWI